MATAATEVLCLPLTPSPGVIVICSSDGSQFHTSVSLARECGLVRRWLEDRSAPGPLTLTEVAASTLQIVLDACELSRQNAEGISHLLSGLTFAEVGRLAAAAQVRVSAC